MVKNLPPVQKMWVQFLGREDPLANEMVAYSSILAWEISWAEEPGGLHPWDRKGVGHDLVTNSKMVFVREFIKSSYVNERKQTACVFDM